ncbi:hypothetical protein Tco_0918775 [Tanacetum coccineum]
MDSLVLTSKQKDLVFVKSSTKDSQMYGQIIERPWLSEENNIMPNYDTVCSTPLHPLGNNKGAKPQYGPRTIKSILKACITRKSKTSKEVIIDETNNSSTPAKENKNAISASKKHSAPAEKRKDVKTEDDTPLSLAMKELQELKLQVSKNK